MEHGPLAGRYYAACIYAHLLGHRPRNWDWAAQSLAFSASRLRDGVFGSAREKSPAASPPSQQTDTAPNPKVNVRLSEGVSPPNEDLLNYQGRSGRGMCSPSPSPSTHFGESTPRSHSGDKGSQRPADQRIIEIAPLLRALVLPQDHAPRPRHPPRGIKDGMANVSEN